MVIVDFIDEINSTSEEERNNIHELLNFAYKFLEQTNEAEVSVSFVDEEIIQDLNRIYRDKDSVTDVISFAIEEEEGLIHEDAIRTLGDIVICVKRAKEQAYEYGHSYKREISFLALHGFLHLLGYDHIEEDDRKEMNDLQDNILNEYGITRDV